MFVYEVLQHPLDPTFKQCVTFNRLNTITLKLVYGFYNLMGLYGIPLLIMVFCFIRIFLKLTFHASESNEKTLNQYDESLKVDFNHKQATYFSKMKFIKSK